MLIYNETLSKIVNFDNIRELCVRYDDDYHFEYRLYADDCDLGGYLSKGEADIMLDSIFKALVHQEQVFYLRSEKDYYDKLKLGRQIPI